MEEIKLLKDGKRLDGRALDELRTIRIEAGVLNQADGSALVEWGKNKVVCGVFKPGECIPRHEASPYEALLKVRYTMSPFASLEEHGRSGPSRRSTELSKVIREVFENVVLTEEFPGAQIQIYIDVLQADGGTRVAAITAASVALANAGIPMRDMVAAVAVGKIDGRLAVDLGKDEDNFGQSDTPVAIAHRTSEFLLLQMDGQLTREELMQATAMALEATEEVHAKQKEALLQYYEKGKRGELQL
ncbi:MAG TPA: exosome complex exonuclease Rrp41 [Candidatus Bilamarchaeaceae archaeon]|nr:exosome complex exonuclease Rrp41 [Candidatus Bilamarchaeaceae archaeon]